MPSAHAARYLQVLAAKVPTLYLQEPPQCHPPQIWQLLSNPAPQSNRTRRVPWAVLDISRVPGPLRNALSEHPAASAGFCPNAFPGALPGLWGQHPFQTKPPGSLGNPKAGMHVCTQSMHSQAFLQHKISGHPGVQEARPLVSALGHHSYMPYVTLQTFAWRSASAISNTSRVSST